MSAKVIVFHIAGGPSDEPARPLFEYVQHGLLPAQNEARATGTTAEFITYDTVDWRKADHAVISHIRQRCQTEGAKPVIMLHTVHPFTGACVSPDLLRRFPSVVFSHQLALLPREAQRQTLQYLQNASRAIVTTPIERDAAIDLSKQFAPSGSRSLSAETFFVIDVPPTIAPDRHIDASERTGDIAVFGMLRRGKGLGDVVRLAELLAGHNPALGKTIHVVGHVADRPDSVTIYKYLLARTFGIKCRIENAVGDEELARRIKGEFIGLDEAGRRLQELGLADCKKLVLELQNGTSQADGELSERLDHPVPRRVLPIRFHISLSNAEVSSVLRTCRYSYLPMEGGELDTPDCSIGLTKHSSSATVSAAHGLLMLAPIGSLTPEELRNGEVVDTKSPAQALESIKRYDLDSAARNSHIAKATAWISRTSWRNAALGSIAVCRDAVARFEAEAGGRIAA